VFTTAAVTSTPTPTPRPIQIAVPSSVYGTGINADTKANLQVGGGKNQKVAYRFAASTTSALTSVRFVQRGGSGYSSGNGGSMRISLRPDDGSGRPSATILASVNYSPGNPSGAWEHYDAVTFGSPATLTAGSTYLVVFENTDASPAVNFISANELYVYGGTLTPRQPHYADAYATLTTASGSWAVAGGYTAVADLAYANGTHDGMGYFQALIGYYGVISGSSSMARERFTVSGGSRTVTTASVRVRRSSGSSPLTVRLETGAGTLIEAVNVPASAVPISAPGGDTGGAVWATVTFASAHVLADGATYNLRISTAADTTYTTFPIQEGGPNGFGSYTYSDGTGQHTTDGSTWTDLYLWAPQDMQFFFR
jgi:hypothetical protein